MEDLPKKEYIKYPSNEARMTSLWFILWAMLINLKKEEEKTCLKSQMLKV